MLDDLELQMLHPIRLPHMVVAQSPEGRMIFPRMSVMENLEMGAMRAATRTVFNRILNAYCSSTVEGTHQTKRWHASRVVKKEDMLAMGRALMLRGF